MSENNEPVTYRRGELYWVDWSPGRGSEQLGHRPALIVSTNAGNTNSRYSLVIVAAVSTRIRDVPTHVRLEPSEENGLRQPSDVLCEQILTISKDRLQDRIGAISAEDQALVDTALKRALALR